MLNEVRILLEWPEKKSQLLQQAVPKLKDSEIIQPTERLRNYQNRCPITNKDATFPVNSSITYYEEISQEGT
jgi:hypothetical protein